jgi:hypothetical protein
LRQTEQTGQQGRVKGAAVSQVYANDAAHAALFIEPFVVLNVHPHGEQETLYGGNAQEGKGKKGFEAHVLNQPERL